MKEPEKHSPKWLLNKIESTSNTANKLFFILEFQKELLEEKKDAEWNICVCGRPCHCLERQFNTGVPRASNPPPPPTKRDI